MGLQSSALNLCQLIITVPVGNIIILITAGYIMICLGYILKGIKSFFKKRKIQT